MLVISKKYIIKLLDYTDAAVSKILKNIHQKPIVSLGTFFKKYPHTISFVLLAVPLTYFSYSIRSFQGDDSLIYMRYIRNLIQGNGLVYNIGDKFNGLTSPLYTYILSVLAYIFQNIQIVQIVFSSLCLFGALWMFMIILERFFKINIYYSLIGAVFAVTLRYFYACYGMETTLYLFICSLTVYYFYIKNYYLLGIFVALMLLTRSEGIFLFIALGIEHFRLKRTFPNWKCFIIPLLIILGHYTFNYIYYGQFLPMTANAKILQGKSEYWGKWPTGFLRVSYIIKDFFGSPIIYMLLAFLAFFAFYKRVKIKGSSLEKVVFFFLLFYSLFGILLNIPNYFWYYSNYVFFMCFYLGLAVENILNNSRITAKMLVFFLLPLLLYYQVGNLKNLEWGRYNYNRAGIWIEENTHREAKVAAVEIGIIGWYSKRYIIDILGLVNPLNAEFIGNKDTRSWLKHYKPDYILVHNPLWHFESAIELKIKNKEYIKIKDFEHKTNSHYSLVLYKRNFVEKK